MRRVQGHPGLKDVYRSVVPTWVRDIEVMSCMLLPIVASYLGVPSTENPESRNWKLETGNWQPCSSVIPIPPRRDAIHLGGRRSRRGGSAVLKCRDPRSADNDRRRFPVSDFLVVVSLNPPQIVDIGHLLRDLWATF